MQIFGAVEGMGVEHQVCQLGVFAEQENPD